MTARPGLPEPGGHVHFVGVGGIGMSGLARILAAWGFRVTGTDSQASELIDRLTAEGIATAIGHDDTANAAAADLVVATAALRSTNPELHAASAAGVRTVKRAELLGLLANERRTIAVAGSHGKSTTSGMLVSALTHLDQDPSYAVGALVGTTGTNAAPGEGELMVVEADEYDHSFLSIKPTVAIVTNIDFDHPDIFPNQAAYDRAYRRFLTGVPADGTFVVNADDVGTQRVLADSTGIRARAVSVGHSHCADWRLDGDRLTTPDGQDLTLELQVAGAHNLLNAAMAVAALDAVGTAPVDAARGIATFTGVGRRFELKGEAGGVTVVDDYAHHPVEIAATLAAARGRYPGRRVWAVFQPHTYSRTKLLLDEFARVLDGADGIVLLDVYPARETDTLGVSSEQIARRMVRPPLEVRKPADAAATLAEWIQEGDVVLTMGAGDVTHAGPALLTILRGR